MPNILTQMVRTSLHEYLVLKYAILIKPKILRVLCNNENGYNGEKGRNSESHIMHTRLQPYPVKDKP